MKPIHALSSRQITANLLPGRCAIIRMADEAELLPAVKDQDSVVSYLDCVFDDLPSGERAPTSAHAKRIAAFLREADADSRVEHIVAQCQAGIGRSVAVAAAYLESHGQRREEMAAYNRTLYRLLLAEFGKRPAREPLVSLAVRVKYDAETLMGFLISLRKQRHENWQAVLFTDGDRPDVKALVDTMPSANITLMLNTERKGRWGHPYRQAALEQCEGEWIGTNNDDNYLTPGYLEQMVRAGERSGAPLVVCAAVHRYAAWGCCKTGQDLACWIARKELVKQVQWTDTDFLADERYLSKLMEAADGKHAEVLRPLVVKN